MSFLRLNLKFMAGLAFGAAVLTGTSARADRPGVCEQLFGVESPVSPREGSATAPQAQQRSTGPDANADYDPLYYIRRQQKAKDPNVLQGDASTPELSAAFSLLLNSYIQNRPYVIDSAPVEMLRLMGYSTYEKFKASDPQGAASKLYGIATFHAWKEADDYLASIPIGQFKITPELIHKIGGISGRHINRLPITISGFTPDSRGTFKIRPNFGSAPLTEPLTESQYQILKSNTLIEGFLELPSHWSKPNARRGVIVYSLPHQVPAKLAKLIDWYERNKDSLDPIRLAVEFQRQFISIHPLIDGNGRASRLIMDRILLEHGLPPALILEHDMDLYSPVEDYERAVRLGVADSINLLKNSFYIMESEKRLEMGLSTTDQEAVSHRALAAKYTQLVDFKFNVGDRIFSLMNDGFIYDQYGIPHEYNNGRFYPIADRLTTLYDFGGKVKVEKPRLAQGQRQSEPHNIEIRRDFSPLKKIIFAKHLRIVEKIKANQVNANALTVESLDTIRQANNAGQAFIYPWQEKQFAADFAARTEDTEMLLTPFHAWNTTYTELVRSGHKPPASLTLSQYEYVDLNLYDYERASANLPRLRAAIRNQRRLIHKAARERIMASLNEFDKLSKADQAIAEKDFRYQLFKSYLQLSKLFYPTFDDAVRAGADNYVPLLRNANVANTAHGFIPISVVRNILQRIPYFDRVVLWAKSINEEISSKGVDAVIQEFADLKHIPPFIKKRILAKLNASKQLIGPGLSVFVNDMIIESDAQIPYSLAGAREIWRLKNRAAGNDRDEGGLSFSTSPDLYFNGANFAQGSGSQIAVSLVRAPRRAVIENFVSSYTNEYEVIGFRVIMKRAIVKQFDGTQMQKFDFSGNALGQVMSRMLGISLTDDDGSAEVHLPSNAG